MGSKIKKHLRGSTQAIIHPVGQFDGLGEYYGPHTASEVFLILILDTEGVLPYSVADVYINP